MAEATATRSTEITPRMSADTRPSRPSDTHQEHPIRIYLVVWGWLFVLSACSYMVDYVELQGYLRWSLILIFMVLKAGLIVAVFMHMAWERLALAYAIILPPLAGAGVRRDNGARIRLHASDEADLLRRQSLIGDPQSSSQMDGSYSSAPRQNPPGIVECGVGH